ncbi:LPXTG cell wall anchor domain-containing protein, partial [uncultured Gemella sp.]|uniref:LPXTG cell wall anchor domain-containing protein n=1 Tax=uncultured Gemella sp. TaxID=254352 RepID=UPI0028EAF500
AAEEPKKEEPKPATETPKKEESKPATETPKKEESKPATETPKKEEVKPAAEEPKKEEPKPAAETPKEEPKSTTEESKKEEGNKPQPETPKEEPKPTTEEPKKEEGNRPQPEGPKVDKKKLNEQLAHLAEVKEKDSFESASAEDKKAYLDAVQKAQELLASATATQEEVDKALETLKEAEKKVYKKSIKDILGGFVGKETKKENTFNVDEDFGKVSKSNSLLAKTGLDNNATAYAGIAVLVLAGLTVYLKRRRQK